MRSIRIAVMGVVASGVLLSPRSPAQVQGAEACGPYALNYQFMRVTSPDDPGAYLAGRIGIVTPTFRLPWLVGAWRHLAGHPLTAEERSAIWAPDAPAGTPYPQGTVFGPQRWLRVSREVLKEPEQYRYIDQSAETPAGAYYENCPSSAFEFAAATLQARVGSLGAGDATIKPWIEAQELVWANCAHKKGEAAKVPAPLSAAATPLAKADRAYQIAAAAFYAGDWAEAVQGFRAIAADRSSPWRPYGEYLAARALLRKGMIGGADGAIDAAALGDAVAAFDTVAADGSSPLKASAAGLKRFAELRRRPDAMRAEVLARLTTPSPAVGFDDTIAEYRYLFLRDVPDPTNAGRTADPLTDWIDTLRSTAPGALPHAVARWREKQELPWLVAAMLMLTPTHADEAALVAAAKAVPATSPAYATLAFHRARLLVLEGQLDAARGVAGEIRKASASWPPSAVNQLRALELRLATTAEAFFAAAAQLPVGFDADEGEDVATLTPTEPIGLSTDALDIVNERLPLSRLVDAAAVPGWPAVLRRNALDAAFSRALLLDDAAALRRVDRDVRATWPELAPDLDALAKATAADERRFVIARLFLRYPGLRPFMTGGQRRVELDWSKQPPPATYTPLGDFDELRDNWWCGLTPSPSQPGGVTTYAGYQPGIYGRSGARLDPTTASLYADASAVPWPAWLTADERASVEREWKALAIIEAAPDFLGHEVLAWAAAHPTDARLAEALHRVVRATRSGCTGEKTGDVSKEAFTVLHKRFPASEWAKKTPYWFR